MASWRDLIKYPNLLGRADPRVVEILDTLEELIPIEEGRDRLMRMSEWLDKAYNEELITPNEDVLIKHELIHGCGGF